MIWKAPQPLFYIQTDSWCKLTICQNETGLSPSSCYANRRGKILQLLDVALCPVIGHIVDHDLKDPVEHSADNDMAKLIVQDRDIPVLPAQDLQKSLGRFHFKLRHLVDEMLIAGALGLADQQLELLRMPVDVVQYCRNTVLEFHPRMSGLFLFRQIRGIRLRFQELPITAAA